MPFSGASDPNLPSNVIDRSLEIRQQWVGAWNGRFTDCREDGGSTESCESSAFAVANAAIKERGTDMTETTDVTDASHVTDVGEKIDSFTRGPEYWDFLDRQVSQEAANYNPVGGSGERACSNCQWFIAPQSCVVVSSFPQPIVPNGLSDLWRAVPAPEEDALLVRIVGESALGVKQETKTEGGIEFKPSDFAVMPDPDAPSGWKLRLAEGSSGNFTVAQVARAITAMQPGGFRGNKVQLTTEQKSQAVGRIGRAIGRVDGDEEAKDNLRERLDAVKEIQIVDKTVRRAKGAMRTVLEMLGGKPVSVADTVPGAVPPEGITFTKDKSGDTRWIATFSNNFRDRDNPPEVFTDAAHKEFVAHIDQGGKMPELWLWHTPGTKMGVADWIDYANGFVTATGTIDPGHEQEAEALASMKDLGLSHGYHYIPGRDGAIDWYRSFEITVLPDRKAANPWLDFAMIESEVKEMKFNDEKRPFLVSVLGEEKVATLEKDQEGRAKFLTDLGVDSKEYETPDPKPKDPEPVPAISGAEVGPLVAAITKGVVESTEFKGMADRIGVMEAAVGTITASVKTLEESDDSKIHRAFTAAFDPSKLGHVASQAKDNELEEEEAKATVKDVAFFDQIYKSGVESAIGRPD